MFAILLIVGALMHLVVQTEQVPPAGPVAVNEAVIQAELRRFRPSVAALDTLVAGDPYGALQIPDDLLQFELGKNFGFSRLRVLVGGGHLSEPYILISELRSSGCRSGEITFVFGEEAKDYKELEAWQPRTIRLTGKQLSEMLGAPTQCAIRFNRWISPTEFLLDACGVDVFLKRQQTGDYRISYTSRP